MKLYEEAQQAAEAAKKEMEDAKQAFQILQGDEDELDDDPTSYSVPLTISSHGTTRVNAPDDWIEEYCSGKEKHLVIRAIIAIHQYVWIWRFTPEEQSIGLNGSNSSTLLYIEQTNHPERNWRF
jgi:hypothetical protein